MRILSNLTVFQNGEWLPNHSVLINHGAIEDIDKSIKVSNNDAEKIEFDEGCLLIPGLIDLHIHGIKGYDVMDATPSALSNISNELAKTGVTSFLATTMSESSEQIETALQAVAGFKSRGGANLLGVHLEGPFLSPEKCGAQAAQYLQLPNAERFRKWQRLSGNKIKLVTIAPELEGAIEFIKEVARSVVVSVGHANATYDQVNAAIAAGASYATHLFNAMRGMHQREPGAVGAILLSDMHAELIADGVHVHPAMLELALRQKKNCHLVTDAMRACCMPDGEYDLGGQKVFVESGHAMLADGTIAGSTLTMLDAVKKVAKMTACSIERAIEMATIEPAKAIGVDDKKGSIEVGKDADLVVLNEAFEVQRVFVC